MGPKQRSGVDRCPLLSAWPAKLNGQGQKCHRWAPGDALMPSPCLRATNYTPSSASGSVCALTQGSKEHHGRACSDHGQPAGPGATGAGARREVALWRAIEQSAEADNRALDSMAPACSLALVLGTQNGRSTGNAIEAYVVSPDQRAVPSTGTADAEVVVAIRRVTPPAFEGQASRHAFASQER